MRKLGILILIMLLAFPHVISARTFTGNANITVIEPTDTILAICTPNEKYTMEPGTTRLLRLYVRNDMDDKLVRRVDLEIPPVEGFAFSFTPEYLEDLAPEKNKLPSYKYFDIIVTADENIDYGNYRVNFLLGTDEYLLGGFSDDIMIKVRKYGTAKIIAMGAISIIIFVSIIARYFWIMSVNRKARQRPKKVRKRREVSEYYYKDTKQK